MTIFLGCVQYATSFESAQYTLFHYGINEGSHTLWMEVFILKKLWCSCYKILSSNRTGVSAKNIVIAIVMKWELEQITFFGAKFFKSSNPCFFIFSDLKKKSNCKSFSRNVTHITWLNFTHYIRNLGFPQNFNSFDHRIIYHCCKMIITEVKILYLTKAQKQKHWKVFTICFSINSCWIQGSQAST